MKVTHLKRTDGKEWTEVEATKLMNASNYPVNMLKADIIVCREFTKEEAVAAVGHSNFSHRVVAIDDPSLPFVPRI